MTKQPSKTRPATKPGKAPRAAKGAAQAEGPANTPGQAADTNTARLGAAKAPSRRR